MTKIYSKHVGGCALAFLKLVLVRNMVVLINRAVVNNSAVLLSQHIEICASVVFLFRFCGRGARSPPLLGGNRCRPNVLCVYPLLLLLLLLLMLLVLALLAATASIMPTADRLPRLQPLRRATGAMLLSRF